VIRVSGFSQTLNDKKEVKTVTSASDSTYLFNFPSLGVLFCVPIYIVLVQNIFFKNIYRPDIFVLLPTGLIVV
jgi:hypothetical protein